MLNEKYEYEQYMARVMPDNCVSTQGLTPAEFIEKYGMRLGYRRLVTAKEPGGVKRSLLLIARDFLSVKSNDEDKEKAVECLKSWCGMIRKIKDEYKDNPEVIACQNLLPGYIEFVLGYKRDQKGKEAVDNRKKDITNKGWTQAGFNFDIDTSDYHGIKFERIVAEALVSNEVVGNGLDRYYLISTNCTDAKEIFRDIYWKSEPKDFVLGENGWTAGRKNKILMAVAVKRMKDRTEHSRWFPKVDFSNWMQDSSGNSNGFGPIKFEGENQERVPLFTEKKLISSQEDKELIINEEWKNRCGWEVVTKEELWRKLSLIKDQSKLPVFYRDYYFKEDNCKENGVFLQQNKFYREEKEFWEEKAKENKQLEELYKRSFGET